MSPIVALKVKLAVNRIPRSSCGFCNEERRGRQNLSNNSRSQICSLTNRCRAPKDLLFLTNQTKGQILDYGKTTRSVYI